MSDILLDIFQQILEGTYVASNLKKILTIEGREDEEYEFSPTYSFDNQQVQRSSDTEPTASILPDFQQIAYDEAPIEAKTFISDFNKYAELQKNFSEEEQARILDLAMIFEELITRCNQHLAEIPRKTLNELLNQEELQKIADLKNQAKGCDSVCDFCKRKCELPPHIEE